MQFWYQAADCRVFYTKEVLTDRMVAWKRTVDGMSTQISPLIELGEIL